MAVDEAARRQLRTRLVEVLGEEEAITLMTQLPPSGWGEVATRSDVAEVAAGVERLSARVGDLSARVDGLSARVDGLSAEMDRRFADVDRRLEAIERQLVRQDDMIDALRREIVTQTRVFLFGVVTSTSMVGVFAFTAARLV
ncbi:hypothetical protein BH23ACT8_BH23ACT8_14040 [soil metagenome]